MGNKKILCVLILLISISFISSFGFDNPEIPSLRVPTGNVTYNQNITNNYYNLTQGMDYTNLALINVTNTFTENQIIIGNITASNFCNTTDCYDVSQFLNGGWISKAESDLNMSSYSLTDVGELFMQGLITSEDIIPTTHDLYKLGNSSNWFSHLYVTSIEAKNITSDFLSSTTIESQEINSVNISSEFLDSSEINSENITSKDLNISNEITVSGYTITEEDDYMTFKLKS